MRKTAIICLVVVFALLLTTGAVKAIQILGADVAKVGELEAGSLTVGEQGVGGVTFFNGTIINDTTDSTSGQENPVTFGDDVRIDGRIFRGSFAGTNDDKPLSINDNVEIAGTLTVGGEKISSQSDNTSRFDKVDGTLGMMYNEQLGQADTLNIVSYNVGITNDSVGNAISTTGNAHNNQVDILNQLSYHAVINCLNTDYLAGGDGSYCEDPIYIGDLVYASGFRSSSSSGFNVLTPEMEQKDPIIQTYLENEQKLRDKLK